MYVLPYVTYHHYSRSVFIIPTLEVTCRQRCCSEPGCGKYGQKWLTDCKIHLHTSGKAPWYCKQLKQLKKKTKNAEVRRPFCIGSAFLGKRASDGSNPAEEIWFLEFFVNARLIFHCSNDSIMHRGVGDPKHLN